MKKILFLVILLASYTCLQYASNGSVAPTAELTAEQSKIELERRVQEQQNREKELKSEQITAEKKAELKAAIQKDFNQKSSALGNHGKSIQSTTEKIKALTEQKNQAEQRKKFNENRLASYGLTEEGKNKVTEEINQLTTEIQRLDKEINTLTTALNKITEEANTLKNELYGPDGQGGLGKKLRDLG
jgi:chromosome segregation ATPase